VFAALSPQQPVAEIAMFPRIKSFAGILVGLFVALPLGFRRRRQAWSLHLRGSYCLLFDA
jgi:hypothetical protein